MSTKIFNGYLHPASDLETVFQSFHAKRPQIAEIAADIIARFYARGVARQIDNIVKTDVPHRPDLVKLMMELMDRQKRMRAEKTRDTEIDVESSVVVIPSDDKVLVLVYAERTEIETIITDDLIPYFYWNNSEAPEDVTPEEWAQRERDWHTALARDPVSRPGGCGFTIEFLTSAEVPNIDRILANLPSDEKRATEIIHHQEIAVRLTPDMDFNEIMRIVSVMSGNRADPARLEEVIRTLTPITRETFTHRRAS